MRIRLFAFGKLHSDVMDVPEDTGYIMKIALYQAPTDIHMLGEKIATIPPQNILCEFEYTGQVDGETMAKIYVLRDMTKA